jgi:hypothetical protein
MQMVPEQVPSLLQDPVQLALMPLQKALQLMLSPRLSHGTCALHLTKLSFASRH